VLVIADDAKPLAMAGIMGGEESGITLETTELFLESAFFAPKGDCRPCPPLRLWFRCLAPFRARRRFRRHSSRHRARHAPDSRYLWRRRPDPVVEASAEMPARKPVRLRTARAAKVLGMPITAEQIAKLFSGLGYRSPVMAMISWSRRQRGASTLRSKKT
jgi:phenylalanyl-tRNA synthetase beta chain